LAGFPPTFDHRASGAEPALVFAFAPHRASEETFFFLGKAKWGVEAKIVQTKPLHPEENNK
jgi:hypothetical protein